MNERMVLTHDTARYGKHERYATHSPSDLLGRDTAAVDVINKEYSLNLIQQN